MGKMAKTDPVHDFISGLEMGDLGGYEDKAEHWEMETWRESSLLIPTYPVFLARTFQKRGQQGVR